MFTTKNKPGNPGRKVSAALLTALLVICISLVFAVPGGSASAENKAVLGTRVAPWDDASGDPNNSGSSLLPDGSYSIALTNFSYNVHVFNTADTVNLKDFSITFDLSEWEQGADAAQSFSLGISNGIKKGFWDYGNFYLRIDRGTTSASVHILRNVNNANEYKSGFLTEVTATGGVYTVSFKQTGEDTITVTVNGKSNTLSISDITDVFWDDEADIENLNLCITGAKEGSDVNYLKVSPAGNAPVEPEPDPDNPVIGETVAPWDAKDGNVQIGSAAVDGGYKIAIKQLYYTNHIFNNTDKVSLAKFSLTVDLSEYLYGVDLWEHFTLSLSAAPNKGFYNDNLYLRFDKNLNGTMNVHVMKDDNNTGMYSADFLTQVSGADSVFTVAFDMTAANVLTVTVNDKSNTLNLNNVLAGFWKGKADMNAIYLSFTGAKRESDNISYLTVSEVITGASALGLERSVSDYETAVGSAADVETLEALIGRFDGLRDYVSESGIEGTAVLLARLDAAKQSADAKYETLTAEPHLVPGVADPRAPFYIDGERSGTFYNEEDEIYEIQVHQGGHGPRVTSDKGVIDFTNLDIVMDISKIPYSSDATVATYIIFSPEYHAFPTDTDVHIPLLMSVVRNISGSVSIYFFRNWTVSSEGYDFKYYGAGTEQIVFSLGVTTTLSITSKLDGDNVVMSVNGKEAVLPLSTMNGDVTQPSGIFVKNCTVETLKTDMRFSIVSNSPGTETLKLSIRKFYTPEEKEYKQTIKPNTDAYAALKAVAEDGIDDNLSIALAKRHIAAIDWDLFNEADVVRYEGYIAKYQGMIDEAIDALGDGYDPGFDIVAQFIAKATQAASFDDLIEASALYSYLTADEQARTDVEAAYALLLDKGAVDGWTSMENLIAFKGNTDITIRGSSFDDVLLSDQKFIVNNFTATLKLDVWGDNWLGFGLMKNKNGFDAGVTIDNATEKSGIFLLIRHVSGTKYNVEVYMIKTSSVDMWAAMRGSFDIEVGATKDVVIRFYPDANNIYLQMDVNGVTLTNNRIRLTEVNGVFGNENEGYIAVQTAADAGKYHELKLFSINNKSVFDTGVRNPDPQNIPDYGNGNGGEEPRELRSCNSSTLSAGAALASLIAVSLLIIRKRREA